MKTVLVTIGIIVAIVLSALSLAVNLGREGKQGVGITNIKELNNNAVIYLSDGGFYVLPLPQGRQGEPGIGINGKDGKDGINGVNGKDGKDGAIGAQGVQGVAGVNGKDGATGATGAAGTAGDQGLQGLQGVQGVAGTNGTNGVDGINGTDGVSITGAYLNCYGCLILTLSDGSTIDVGNVLR